MALIQEYKKQGIYIFLGLIVLLFPFLNESFLVFGFFGSALVFLFISPKLKGLVHLFFTMGALLLTGKILGFEKFPLFIIGGAFAITTFGYSVADIINIHDKARNGVNKQQSDVKVYSAKSSMVFLISGGASAFLAGAWISAETLPIPLDMIFFLSVLGAISGALLESIILTEDNTIILSGSAMTMWLFYTFSHYVAPPNLIQVIVFAFVLGYLAYKARIADISAMLSAALFGVVIIIFSDIIWFFILLTFFFLGSLFTHYKYNYKLARGIAELKGGARGYKNVFSNSLASLSMAVAYGVFPSHDRLLLSAYLGSVATAAGDTLASEIGETSKGEPRMITTFKKVRAGTDGAVSGLGECAAFFGASVIGLVAYLLIPDMQKDFALVIAAVAGGFIGTNVDSVLGATLQQKGYLSNNGVNLFATISGTIISGMIYYIMGS